jgi:hypothetical protein
MTQPEIVDLVVADMWDRKNAEGMVERYRACIASRRTELQRALRRTSTAYEEALDLAE